MGRPGGHRPGGGQLGGEKDDLSHDDEEGGRSEDVPAAQHGHQQHDPRRKVDEYGERVENREGLDIVPGHEAHHDDDSQQRNHGPQGNGHVDRQAPLPPPAGMACGP